MDRKAHPGCPRAAARLESNADRCDEVAWRRIGIEPVYGGGEPVPRDLCENAALQIARCPHAFAGRPAHARPLDALSRMLATGVVVAAALLRTVVDVFRFGVRIERPRDDTCLGRATATVARCASPRHRRAVKGALCG